MIFLRQTIIKRGEKRFSRKEGEIDTFLYYTNITRIMLKVNRHTRFLSGNNYIFTKKDFFEIFINYVYSKHGINLIMKHTLFDLNHSFILANINLLENQIS